ncbi:hypothetical protein SRHO_G00267690 [Serrasalmus rhombeus]
MENGLGVHDGPPPPSAVQTERLQDPQFFKKIAEELVRWLESTFHPGFPVFFLFECLVDCLMEEVEMLAVVNIISEARDEVDAISYIVSEVYEDLLNQPRRMVVSCFNEGTISYISCAVIRALINYISFY